MTTYYKHRRPALNAVASVVFLSVASAIGTIPQAEAAPSAPHVGRTASLDQLAIEPVTYRYRSYQRRRSYEVVPENRTAG